MSSFLSFKNSFSSKHNHNLDSLSVDFTNLTIPEETAPHHTRPMNSKERLESLLLQVEDVELRTLMQHELRTILTDQQRLVTMLEQRFDLVENEGRELKLVINDSQRRYEKAVREMQFFKKKYDALKTGTSNSPSELTSTVTNNSHHTQYWPTSPTTTIASSVLSDPAPTTTRIRKNSNTAGSIFSSMSSGTDATSIYSNHRSMYDEKRTNIHHHTPPPPSSSSNYQYVRNPSMVSSYSTPSNAPSMFSGASSIISVPITPTIRSSVSTTITAMTGNSMIQQRRTDPLTFGGSDALWDTISKDQGSDVTIDKIIRYHFFCYGKIKSR